MKRILAIASITVLLASCGGNGHDFDATGTFEADDVIVSAEASGKILSLQIEEGATIAKDSVVGTIDAENIALQKEQVEASIEALGERTADVSPQVKLLQDQYEVQKSRLNNLLHERTRTQNLVKADAATQKQLDDMDAQIDVVRKEMNVTQAQINVQKSNTGTQNRGILSEGKPLSKRAAQLEEQLQNARIVNPINGIVLTKYAEQGEVTSIGKALYKIADLSTITLKAYISGSQLPQVKPGQQVRVFVDDGKDKYRELPGTLTWIADKAEFTPKTIQTKDERANLVYAIKVKVKNDGYLKIGMYGEVKLN